MQVHNVRLINIFIRNKRLLKHILILSRVRVMSDKTYLSGYMYAMEAVYVMFSRKIHPYMSFFSIILLNGIWSKTKKIQLFDPSQVSIYFYSGF